MRALLWFKQDLHLDDHSALQAGLAVEFLLSVYVLDPALLQLTRWVCGLLTSLPARKLARLEGKYSSAARIYSSPVASPQPSADEVIKFGNQGCAAIQRRLKRHDWQ